MLLKRFGQWVAAASGSAIALLTTTQAQALPAPRVDLPEGVGIVYQAPTDSFDTVWHIGSSIGLDYRNGRWAGGIGVATARLSMPVTDGYDLRSYFDPYLHWSYSFLEWSWLTAGVGGAFGTRTPNAGMLHALSSSGGLCASVHHTMKVGGQDVRLFFDPTVTLSLDRSGSATLGKATGFVTGVGINGGLEFMLGTNSSELSATRTFLIDTVVTGVRATLF